ncbi:hypothetical protein GOP47_0026007 [Adiantum capillus-veneris]|uniref:Uncharacterized protein n=1 Tax=Adiantum capillus-veneris TaxID=13818 RepID=A0A9D4U292_ADICA|nr:hypothetical protein GOP47_0026007 [Adiantum capillus-veneris]
MRAGWYGLLRTSRSRKGRRPFFVKRGHGGGGGGGGGSGGGRRGGMRGGGGASGKETKSEVKKALAAIEGPKEWEGEEREWGGGVRGGEDAVGRDDGGTNWAVDAAAAAGEEAVADLHLEHPCHRRREVVIHREQQTLVP